MNKKITLFSIVAILFAVAFSALVVQAQPSERIAPAAAAYEAVLGKSLNDRDVTDFISSNACSGTGQFQLCRGVGVALQIGQGQKVDKVYLYPNQTNTFSAYPASLPLNLLASDTMASVEEKFGQPEVAYAPQAGWELGLPDQSGTPDYIHYWAVYERFGLTIIYNSPSATDKGASIHAILVSK